MIPYKFDRAAKGAFYIGLFFSAVTKILVDYKIWGIAAFTAIHAIYWLIFSAMREER